MAMQQRICFSVWYFFSNTVCVLYFRFTSFLYWICWRFQHTVGTLLKHIKLSEKLSFCIGFSKSFNDENKGSFIIQLQVTYSILFSVEHNWPVMNKCNYIFIKSYFTSDNSLSNIMCTLRQGWWKNSQF